MVGQIKVITHSNPDLVGSSFICSANVSYQKLVTLFGKPACFDSYKTDAEWMVLYDEHVITIYNYKDGKNYCGDKGMPVEQITDWHIGAGDDGEIAARDFAHKIECLEVRDLLPMIKKGKFNDDN